MKNFSEREEKIIKIIGRKKMTLTEISSELFKKEKVWDGNIKVASAINRIIKKCNYHELNWKLGKIRECSKLYIKREKLC